MKYYIIIGLVLAVFLLLWFTRNVNAEVIDKPTQSENTSVLISDENGCTTYQYPYKVGKDLQFVVKVICQK